LQASLLLPRLKPQMVRGKKEKKNPLPTRSAFPRCAKKKEKGGQKALSTYWRCAKTDDGHFIAFFECEGKKRKRRSRSCGKNVFSFCARGMSNWNQNRDCFPPCHAPSNPRKKGERAPRRNRQSRNSSLMGQKKRKVCFLGDPILLFCSADSGCRKRKGKKRGPPPAIRQ